jgi:hypothetical protein
MHFTHLFYFVKIDNKTALIGMILFDAFTAENGQMVGTIKVLDPLIMLIAKEAVNALLFLKIDVSENAVSLYDFIQNIEIQR